MAILFDLDGTLLDTAPDFTAHVNQLRQELSLTPISTNDIKGAVSDGLKKIVQVGFKDTLHLLEEETLIQKLLASYEQNPCQHTVLFPGIENLLAALATENIPWGVVTNKYHRLTIPILEKLNLLSKAACVVSGDTTKRPKPFPDSLLHACELIQKKPEHCIYIGDAKRDILAGKAAGLKTITALFGYVPDIQTALSWQADHNVHHPDEILPWAKTWIP